MTSLQFAIGTVNDLADEPRDRGRKTGKPLPRGLLSRRKATATALVLAAVGLELAAMFGPAAFVVACAGLGVGLAYDLALRGTPWSWLPLAVGVPLLPVFAWVGATARLPESFAVLLPAAVAAGAGLAIANALADFERDAAAGLATVATRLGRGRAWLVGSALLSVVVVVAVASLAGVVTTRGGGPDAAAGAAVVAGILAIAAGILLTGSGGPERRERGWEAEAVGVGLLAAGWVAALADAGAL